MSWKPRFPLGRTVITPGASNALLVDENPLLPAAYLRRHQGGDWGDLGEEDKQQNEQAADQGGRVFSMYKNVGADRVKIYIITEADRSVTTILLPEEY